ncbi:MAG: hypothetical protein RR359_05750 [Bacilli bacterium]
MKNDEEIINLKKHIDYKTKVCERMKTSPILDDFKFLQKRIKNKEFKGIILYAEAVMWEPIQRPQQLLKQLAKNGYLCFFCEINNKENYVLKEINKNLFVVNGEEILLPLLQNEEIIFYISYFLQYVFSQHFTKKIIWFDILDRLDFFSIYNKYSEKIWRELRKNADFITYSALKLKHYTKSRKSILLQNAANPEDFEIDQDIVYEDLQNIILKGKKIIGYYGAIEKWFEWDIIKLLNDSDKYSIVLIGNIGVEVDKSLKNVYYLGPKKYSDLKYYASHFDVALIPFIVNSITNYVSPVKFFEYLAFHLPVLSTNIYEMKQYKTSVLKIINKKEIKHVEKYIDELIKIDKETVIAETSKILAENTWSIRANKIIELINRSKEL